MNTPAHLLMGAALFGRPGDRRTTLAAVAGGLLPDLSLYLLAAGAFAAGYDGRAVFGRLYFSDGWQAVFAVDNSFVLWGVALVAAAFARSRPAVALCAAALVHLAVDFGLHGNDARMQFWPLSRWRFDSPWSYWDASRGGAWIGAAENALVVVMVVWLLWRHRGAAARTGILALGAAQLAPLVIWRLVF